MPMEIILLNKAATRERRSSAFLPLATVKRVRVRLDFDDWANDPKDEVQFGFEQSFDNGQTWKPWIAWKTHSGRLDKNGQPPWFEIPLYLKDAFRVRAFIISTKSGAPKVLGLTGFTIDGERKDRGEPKPPHSWADTTRKNESAGGGSDSVEISLNSTASGSLIAVFTSCWDTDGDNTAIAVSDTTNGSYSSAFYNECADQSKLICDLSYFANNASGNLTITSNPNGTTVGSIWVCVHEFSGGLTTAPLSGTPATNGSTGTAISSGSFSPPDNDVLLLAGAVGDMINTITENAGSEGFTLSNEFETDFETSSFVFKIISGAPGTVSESWTAGDSVAWAAGIAAFKPSGAESLTAGNANEANTGSIAVINQLHFLSAGTANHVQSAGAATVSGAAILNQEGYRFRNDDGDEATATWKAGQDSNISLPAGSKLRLRMIVDATGDPEAKTLQLEWHKKDSPEPWRKVI